MKENLETILVGTDFSDESATACRYAVAIARMAKARLVLVHAFHVAQGDMTDDRGRKMHFDDAVQRVRQRLEEIRSTQMGGYVNCDIDVRLGHPADEIIAAAEECGADLVVTATRDRSRIAKELLGSVADKLARNVRCPILIVPPDSE